MVNRVGGYSMILIKSALKGFVAASILSLVAGSANAAYLYDFSASPDPSSSGANAGTFKYVSPTLIKNNKIFSKGDLQFCSSVSGGCAGQFYTNTSNLGLGTDFADAINLNGYNYYFENNALGKTGSYVGEYVGQPTAVLTISEIAGGQSAPRNFGLFVGVQADDFRGDLTAAQLGNAFDSLPNTITTTLLANLADGIGVVKGAFETAISAIRDQMVAGDKLVIYLAGHGSSSVGFGVGNEVVQTTPGLASQQYFTDDYLTSQLHGLSDIEKIVIVDACHGGGFWGSNDPLEIFDNGDLDTLENIAMLASASEFGLAYYGDDGRPLIGRTLVDFWSEGGNDALDFNSIDQYVRSTKWHENYDGKLVYEMDLGAASTFNPENLTVTSFKSDDFGQVAAPAVPEPATWLMMLFGMGAVGFSLRRRKNIALRLQFT